MKALFKHFHARQLSVVRGGVLLFVTANLLNSTSCSRQSAIDDANTKPVTKARTNSPHAPLERWGVPVQGSAHIWRDTLSVTVEMRNTTGKHLIILPSLLCVNTLDSTFAILRTDALGVMFYGMVRRWKAGAFDDPVGYDKEYRLQFVRFPSESTIMITYKVPMSLYQARRLHGIKYLHGIEIPCWNSNDTIVNNFAREALLGSEFEFSKVLVPSNGQSFVDPRVINVGTESWRGTVGVSEQDFYLLEDSKAGNIVDSAAESMMVVSRGPQKPTKPKHIAPAWIANEQLNKAIERAEQETR